MRIGAPIVMIATNTRMMISSDFMAYLLLYFLRFSFMLYKITIMMNAKMYIRVYLVFEKFFTCSMNVTTSSGV
jgi:hypothetical protein